MDNPNNLGIDGAVLEGFFYARGLAPRSHGSIDHAYNPLPAMAGDKNACACTIPQ